MPPEHDGATGNMVSRRRAVNASWSTFEGAIGSVEAALGSRDSLVESDISPAIAPTPPRICRNIARSRVTVPLIKCATESHGCAVWIIGHFVAIG